MYLARKEIVFSCLQDIFESKFVQLVVNIFQLFHRVLSNLQIIEICSYHIQSISINNALIQWPVDWVHSILLIPFIHRWKCLTSLVSACPPPETTSSSQSLPCKSSLLRMLQENSPPCWAPFCNATSFLAGCHRSLSSTKGSIVKIKEKSPVNEGRWGRHKLDSDHRALVRKRSDTLGRGSVPQLHLTLAFELQGVPLTTGRRIYLQLQRPMCVHP